MAKSTTPSFEVVEMQVYINSRGRSVMNGTVVVDGEMRTIKIDLYDVDKTSIQESISKVLSRKGLGF